MPRKRAISAVPSRSTGRKWFMTKAAPAIATDRITPVIRLMQFLNSTVAFTLRIY
jgi:hypothetical protein